MGENKFRILEKTSPILHSSFSLSPLLLNSFVLHFFKPLNSYHFSKLANICILLRPKILSFFSESAFIFVKLHFFQNDPNFFPVFSAISVAFCWKISSL
ncbi:hypothetical protein AUK22_10855 [bacterium CG2_30_54_10]|nr:MAG: hypothetical protein AUK22_10855 [bacterium CG2_30_54_10]